MSTDVKRDERFSSESEVLAWIQMSPARIPIVLSPPAADSTQRFPRPQLPPEKSEDRAEQRRARPYQKANAEGLRRSSRLAAAFPVDNAVPVRRLRNLLSRRTLRKLLVEKETLFKFGTFVPRNETEALQSPVAHRWIAGKDLEWLRMGQRGTFGKNWTWNRIQLEFPTYKKSEMGHVFYVFDYNFLGEHRVRLVFDGSRQSPSTYDEMYAPTARQEYVRLFHIVLVEEGYLLGQYDVPQAFLLATIDKDIFVYPPKKGQSEFPGQILKLHKALYGGK
jgi:hypothetical protein